MASCNSTYTPGVGKELSLDQPEERPLEKEEMQRFQAITGTVMYLEQVTRYDISYAFNQLARAMFKPSKAHMAAAKHLLRYLTGTVDFVITYKQGGFKLTAFSMQTGATTRTTAKVDVLKYCLPCERPG